MTKRIYYTQKVEVIETYEISFDESEFNDVVEDYEITGITYDELCDLLADKKPDFLISITDHYRDADGNYVYGPHFVDAREFFTRHLCDEAFQWGYEDRDEIEILSRGFEVIDSEL